jgi:hypothetical protein
MNEKYFLLEPVTIEQRANGDKKEDYIVGYAARFDKWSVTLSDWSANGFVEQIDQRAFDGVDMTKVVSSVNHDFSKILGRADKGSLLLTIDDIGLKYELKVPNTTTGRDTLEDVRNGNLSGSSFVFTTESDKWVFKKDSPDERTVLKVGKLIEVGPVNMPAYPDSSAQAAKRSYDEAKSQTKEEKDKAEKAEFEKRFARLKKKYEYTKLK